MYYLEILDFILFPIYFFFITQKNHLSNIVKKNESCLQNVHRKLRYTQFKNIESL